MMQVPVCFGLTAVSNMGLQSVARGSKFQESHS